ncbi:MAG: MBL fold metallo-hydrolase [Marivibrio sp.]|uniref:MBL fold metallo-hydrolase n=1 Tax=Marivibrio sp. TaxID=2039719 RepID=UPI0032EAA434
MEAVLLGTGCPQCSPRRFGPAALLRTAESAVLVDCGSGVTQRLVAAGTPGRDLDAVVLTHLHSDHIMDLYQLILSSWHQGRDRPQHVVGPTGTAGYVDGLMKLWRAEREQRIAHERRPSTAALEVEVTEIATDGPCLDLGDLRLSAVRVDHAPVKQAFGFVAQDASGRRAAISGDTAYCPALIEAARGAELLIHECFIHREMPVVAGVRAAETVEAVASYHTLSTEVGKVAREAGVGFLMLTHFVPVAFDRMALAEEVAAAFDGPFAIGEDLMRYDLATRRLVHADGVVRLSAP